MSYGRTPERQETARTTYSVSSNEQSRPLSGMPYNNNSFQHFGLMTKNAKTKRGVAKKATTPANVTITVAERRDKQRSRERAKSGWTSGPDSSGSGPSNPYLFSLVNPRAAKDRGIGVPSGHLPSVKFQTKYRVSTTVDAAGASSYVFTPALTYGVLRLGTNSSGGCTLLASSTSTDLSGEGYTAAGYSAATRTAIISTADATDICASGVGIRPVSMQVDFVPTDTVLNEKGLINVRQGARDQLPCRAGTNATVSDEAYFGRAPINLGAIAADSNSYECRASEAVSTYWAPQDEQDFIYTPLSSSDGIVPSRPGDATDEVNFGWHDGAYVSATTGTNVAYLPYQVVETEQGAQVAASERTDIISRGHPWIQFTFTGCQLTAGAVTTVGVFDIYINWEMLSDGSRVVDHSTASVTNPLEIAQALNATALAPMISYPDSPASPITQTHEALREATTHLYDKRVNQKNAIEGTSWLPKLAKAVAPALGAAAGLIPGVGPVIAPLASTGAAFLASLLE